MRETYRGEGRLIGPVAHGVRPIALPDMKRAPTQI